jgi:hypothetical protein
MGSHPGTRGPAWLGASALLAVQITVAALASSAAPASADGNSALSRNLPARDQTGLYSSPGLEAGQAARVWTKAEHTEAAPRLARRAPHGTSAARKTGKAGMTAKAPDRTASTATTASAAKAPVKAAHAPAKAGKAPAKVAKAPMKAAKTTTKAVKVVNAAKATKGVTAAKPAKALKAVAALKARLAAARVSPVLWTRHALFRHLRLPHQQAANRLKHAGLGRRSSGNCVNRHRSTCTSLDRVRLGTLWGIVDLKRRSGCAIVVTGGTETGHAHGPRSHGNGYKIDIEHNRCIDRFIRGKHSGAVRRDGAGIHHEYRPSGHIMYANEPSHWDITFT